MSIQKPLGYIRRHWRGDLPLGIAFWVNLIGVYVVIHITETLLRNSVVDQPGRLFVTALISFLVFRLVVYPWQAVGVLRSCEQSLRDHKNTIWIRCAQAVVVLGIVAIFVDGLNVTRLFFSVRVYEKEMALAAIKKEKTYHVRLRGKGVAYVTGSLDPGVTRELSSLIDKHPDITTIVLESDGGRIFEARGIAKIAKNGALTTYAPAKCYSACTIAFAGGERRILGPGAELGFHRYKLDAKYILPFLDVDKELKKDFDFFLLQGIDNQFLQKVNGVSPTSMWVPSLDELHQAGVIHEVSELQIN